MISKDLAPLFKYLTDTVIGSEEASSLLLTALLAEGHVLIEGAPGMGKTMLAQTLACSIGGEFKRVQFTPDLLPSDLIGYNIYRPNTGNFEFIPGPIFSNFFLADEINRTSARVQSALLESMNEGRVSIDGVSREIPKPFMVIATQNDRHNTGTFPLPEPQLDRFLLSLQMSLPCKQKQTEILLAHISKPLVDNGLNIFLLKRNEILSLQKQVQEVPVSHVITEYIVSLSENLRRLAGSQESISVRASLAVLRAARANAFLDSATAVYPEHVQAVFPSVMRHRILSEHTIEPMDLIQKTLNITKVP